MAQIQDLPELVVINIFRHLHYDSCNSLYNIKKRLPLIAINSNWRKCGLPILYGTLIFEYRMVEVEASSRSTQVIQKSNVGLFRSTQYRELVNSLVMLRSDKRSELIRLENVLQEFLVSLINLLFPGEHNDPLSSTTNTLLKLSFANRSAKERAKTLVSGVVERFVDMFATIKHVDIDFDKFESDVSQLAFKITNALPRPLQSHKNELPNGSTYLSYLTSIPNFSCGYKWRVLSCLPKDCDKEKLESLNILNPTSEFAWQDSSGTDETLVFPKLCKLTLECYRDSTESDTAATNDETKEKPHLEFPELRYLKIRVTNTSGIVFVPDLISSNLNKLVLSGNALVIQAFDKLLIKTIGYLEVHLSGNLDLVTEEFYETANRLFSDIKVTHCASVSLTDKMIDVDLEKIRWANVNKLELWNAGINQFVKWLEKLPTLRSVVSAYNKHVPSFSTATIVTHPLFQLSKSKLQTLTIDNKVADNSSKYMVDITMCLMRSLKELKRVCISKREGPGLWLEFHEGKYQYLHFVNIDLCPVKYHF